MSDPHGIIGPDPAEARFWEWARQHGMDTSVDGSGLYTSDRTFAAHMAFMAGVRWEGWRRARGPGPNAPRTEGPDTITRAAVTAADREYVRALERQLAALSGVRSAGRPGAAGEPLALLRRQAE